MLSGFLFAQKRGKDVALLPGIEDDARLARLSDNTMPLLPLCSDYPELLNENRDT